MRISDWSSDVCSSDLGVGIAEHLHVAAERNEAEFPACARPVVPAEDLRPEADGEHLDADVVPARDQVVAEFVDEHQDGEHGQERQAEERKSVVSGQSVSVRVDLGGRGTIKKKNTPD